MRKDSCEQTVAIAEQNSPGFLWVALQNGLGLKENDYSFRLGEVSAPLSPPKWL